MSYARFGAIGFCLWGLLHVVGAAYILITTHTSGPGAGYMIYGHDGAALPAAAGGILSYFAYLLAISGLTSIFVALKFNWSNSQVGLTLNTMLVAAVELGLVLFLILPGYLSIADALPGLGLFGFAAIFGGVACRRDPSHV
ncbi:hypothetical protein [uncultured Roseibium sp.]|nr:hypothetical protein [uncultured Roseibium sp.]